MQQQPPAPYTTISTVAQEPVSTQGQANLTPDASFGSANKLVITSPNPRTTRTGYRVTNKMVQTGVRNTFVTTNVYQSPTRTTYVQPQRTAYVAQAQPVRRAYASPVRTSYVAQASPVRRVAAAPVVRAAPVYTNNIAPVSRVSITAPRAQRPSFVSNSIAAYY